MMATYTFQAYPAVAKATFTCVCCGNENRTRTFRAECTVNPFNTNPDGSIKSSSEVWRQSAERAASQRDEFMRKPFCKACEDALSYSERRQLHADRRAASIQQTEAQRLK